MKLRVPRTLLLVVALGAVCVSAAPALAAPTSFLVSGNGLSATCGIAGLFGIDRRFLRDRVFLGFFGNRRDVREIQQELEAKGLALTTQADESTSGPASFTLLDPDGNAILVDQHVDSPQRLMSVLQAQRTTS